MTQWTLERGYLIENSSYPRRLKYPTTLMLPVTIPRIDAENVCAVPTLYATFHSPDEIPTGYHKTIYFKQGELLNIQLNAKSLKTDMDLKGFPVDFRKCYFEDERKLKFFKIYSKAHCKLECVANITYDKFGCAVYYTPRDSKTKICNSTHYYSIKESVTDDELAQCDCYPLCNDIKYSYEVEKMELPTGTIPDDLKQK